MPQQLFRVEATNEVRVIEMSLPEILDSAEFDLLNDSILGVVERGAGPRKYVMDLSHVAYMGSAMLGLMVNLRQQVKSSGGTLVLCAMPPSLLRIFRTCCMERLFVIAKSREEALKR